MFPPTEPNECGAYIFPSKNIGRRANVESVLGKNSLLWCWPTVPPGDGLKFTVMEGSGKWIELNRRRREQEEEEDEEDDIAHQA